MPKKVRSAKGQIVDFDLLKIKQQMESAPAPLNVQARQDFIDQKMRRRVKKIKDKLADAKKTPVDTKSKIGVESAKESVKIDEVKPSKRKIKRKTIKK